MKTRSKKTSNIRLVTPETENDHDHDHDHSHGEIIAEPNAALLQAIYDLSKGNAELKAAYDKLFEQTGHALMHCLELRDGYTYGHSMRVMNYATMIGKGLGMSQKELKELEMSAMFHDIGKIGVRDCVLLKEGPLTGPEGSQIRQHPEMGAGVLELIDAYKNIASAVEHHHERFDGRGYPGKLSGDQIPTYARIILVADTFDAMTSTRPYRKMLPIETAYAELIKYSGSQFDDALVEIFLQEHSALTGRKPGTLPQRTKKAA